MNRLSLALVLLFCAEPLHAQVKRLSDEDKKAAIRQIIAAASKISPDSHAEYALPLTDAVRRKVVTACEILMKDPKAREGDSELSGMMRTLLEGEGPEEAVAVVAVADVIGGIDQPPFSRMREILRANFLPLDGIFDPRGGRATRPGWGKYLLLISESQAERARQVLDNAVANEKLNVVVIHRTKS